MRRVVQHSCRNQIQRQKRQKLDHLKSNAASDIAKYGWRQRSSGHPLNSDIQKEKQREEKLPTTNKQIEIARPLRAYGDNDLSPDSPAMVTLQLYIRSWEKRPEAYRQFFALGLKSPLQTSVDAVEQRCWGQETHMLTVMAYSASLYRRLQVLPVTDVQAERLIHKAVQGVRNSLSAPDADPEGVLFDSAYLALLAAYRNEHGAATVHLAAINKLIPVLGGMNVIPTYLSGLFLFADYFLSMQELGRPVIEEQFQQNWRIPAPVMPMHSPLAELGRETLQSEWLTKLSVDLQRIISRIVRCLQVLEHAWSEPTAAVNGFWARRECMVLINQLLIKRHAVDEAQPPKLESRERKFHHKTRDGCSTCRARHIKCDEGKPTCQKCLSRGIECGGYRPKPKIFEPTWSSSPSVSPPVSTVTMSNGTSHSVPRSRANATVLAFWTAIILATTHDLSGARNCLPRLSATVVERCGYFRDWNEAFLADAESMDDFMPKLFAVVNKVEPSTDIRLADLIWQFLLHERFVRSKHEVPAPSRAASKDGHWWSSSVLLR